jgi:hypothetical protein
MQDIEIATEILHLRQTCLNGETLSKTRRKKEEKSSKETFAV